MQHNREAAPDAHLAKLLMRHVELLWTSSPCSKVAPQFAPIELSFFCTRRWNYPWSKRRASICALTSVSVFIWGAFRRAVGALLSRGRRTRRKNWVKRKLASCFFFFFMHLEGNNICTRWAWATRVFHSCRWCRLRRLLKECCGWCCVALPAANTV